MDTHTNIRRTLSMLTQGAAACEAPAAPEISRMMHESVVEAKRSTRGKKEMVSLAAMPMASPQTAVPRKMEGVARDVQEKYTPLHRGKGVQGVGMGDKIKDGMATNELALRVYVEKKLSKKECSKRDMMVPKSLWKKGMDEKITTDVVPIGRLKLELITARTRPARPGCSIFHFKEKDAGTLGCLVVKEGTTSPLYILSNAHVLAMDSTANADDTIIQPAGLDDGTIASDVIATLSESVEFQFDDSALLNTCDAAIAKVKASAVSKIIELIGTPPVGVSKRLRRGMRVRKVGRTTDLTEGTIQDTDYITRPLKYRRRGGRSGSIVFHHQVLCTKFTSPGDSGACVLNSSNKIVGLHFAGSDSASVFNKIGFVMNTFGIKPVT